MCYRVRAARLRQAEETENRALYKASLQERRDLGQVKCEKCDVLSRLELL